MLAVPTGLNHRHIYIGTVVITQNAAMNIMNRMIIIGPSPETRTLDNRESVMFSV